jgi:hypothetical protein
MRNVALSDGSVATVPIFDVKETLLLFPNNPGRVRRENFAANYGPFTGKSTKQIHRWMKSTQEPHGMPHVEKILWQRPQFLSTDVGVLLRQNTHRSTWVASICTVYMHTSLSQ